MAKACAPAPEATAPGAGLFRTFAASLAVVVAGAALLLVATDGGQALTTETLRRAQVDRAPRAVPDLALRGPAGEATTLRRLLAEDGRAWIVDFVYTRCQTVCSALGSVNQQLQQQLLARGLTGRVGLLTISFDPERDDAAALRDYATRLRIDPAAWRIATLASAADRQRLLDAFGIMVIPAPLGEFEHNAALHIVDRNGNLLRIVDFDAAAQALDAALNAASAAAP